MGYEGYIARGLDLVNIYEGEGVTVLSRRCGMVPYYMWV